MKPYLPCPNQGFRVLFSSVVSKFIEIGIHVVLVKILEKEGHMLILVLTLMNVSL